MRILKGLNRPVTAVAFSPDATRLAVAGGMGKPKPIELWDLSSGVSIPYGHPLNEYCRDHLRFDATGRWLLVAGAENGFLAIDTSIGNLSRVGKMRSANELAVSLPGRSVAIYDLEASRLVTLGLTAEGVGRQQWAKSLRGGAHDWQVRGIDMFPEGDRFACIEYRRQRGGVEAFIRIRSVSDGSIVDSISFECDSTWFTNGHVKVSTDGSWIAFSYSNVLMVSHLHETSRDVMPLPVKLSSPNRKHITGLAFHQSGRFLAATSNDTTVRLYDVASGWAITRTFKWDIGKLTSIAFSSDGTLAASGGEKGQVVVWDVDI